MHHTDESYRSNNIKQLWRASYLQPGDNTNLISEALARNDHKEAIKLIKTLDGRYTYKLNETIRENKPGWSLLHDACFNGLVELTMELLLHGARVNVTDATGSTPLHDAVRKGHLRCVKILCEHGADTTKKTSTGETPLDIANSFPYDTKLKTEMINLLQLAWHKQERLEPFQKQIRQLEHELCHYKQEAEKAKRELKEMKIEEKEEEYLLRQQKDCSTVEEQACHSKQQEEAMAHSNQPKQTVDSKQQEEMAHSKQPKETDHSKQQEEATHSKQQGKLVYSKQPNQTVYSKQTKQTVHSKQLNLEQQEELAHSKQPKEIVYSEPKEMLHSRQNEEVLHPKQLSEDMDSKNPEIQILNPEPLNSNTHDSTDLFLRENDEQILCQENVTAALTGLQKDVHYLTQMMQQHVQGFFCSRNQPDTQSKGKYYIMTKHQSYTQKYW